METVDIKSLFQLLKKYTLLIFTTAMIGVGIAACLTFFYLTNQYSASTQVLVTQANDNTNTVQSTEVQANIQMVNTYSIIMQSKDLLKKVAKEYPNYTAKDLRKNVVVASDSNSQVINITVTDDDPRLAVSIVNRLTELFIEESQDLIKTNRVSILSRAYFEDSRQPSGPNHKIHLVIGLLVGVFISLMIIVIKELFDTTLKTEEMVEEALQLPFLGGINQINTENKGTKNKKKNKRKERKERAETILCRENGKSIPYEQMKNIRTSIQFASTKEFNSLMVISPESGTGKSFISTNLALAYAEQGKKVLLVDTDLRRPSIQKMFNKRNTMGVTDVLTGQSVIQDCIQKTMFDNLSILTSGYTPPNPAELLESDEMKQLVAELTDIYDMVIFDTPPVLAVVDSLLLSPLVDGSIFVVRSGYTDQSGAIKAVEKIRATNSRLIGTVLNGKKLKGKGHAFDYY